MQWQNRQTPNTECSFRRPRFSPGFAFSARLDPSSEPSPRGEGRVRAINRKHKTLVPSLSLQPAGRKTSTRPFIGAGIIPRPDQSPVRRTHTLPLPGGVRLSRTCPPKHGRRRNPNQNPRLGERAG